ncbi:MAG TPA: FtsQ-type POTRA domain-containing protein [Candidatus Sulfotelmatobacter sp.]|jgi:cell division protein FtsQ
MARKSAPTILQEELYPPSAPHARERASRDEMRGEIDDARLVDLDVDEESPFLRAQKRVSARRSSLPKKTANRLLWATVAVFVFCVLVIASASLYHYGERSWRFRVESSDNIEVTGMQNVTKAQIMEVMGADIGRNIFFIPLAQQKTQLEQIPWVESASVMRFVPNRLAVQIHERTPVAFARVGPRMFLIDAGGTLMELSPRHKYSFPVILGMNPGEPISTRAPRMRAYAELTSQLDAGGAHYSQDLSEVDLSDLEDLKVRVNDPQGDVLVHLGSSDYLPRYKIYVSHAQGWRQQFQKLESVDLRYDNQIIVNPDMERVAKQSPLTPAALKAAASAGVKPAALLTRITPGERAIPKPAFELTKKTLDSTADANTVKKNPPAKAKIAKRTVVLPKTTVATAKRPAAARPKKARRQVAARHRTVKKQQASSAGARALVSSGKQKPSPGIAKTQASQEPSD